MNQPSNICPATGDAHRWYTPVVRYVHRGGYYTYGPVDGWIRPEAVYCADCQQPAPAQWAALPEALELDVKDVKQ